MGAKERRARDKERRREQILDAARKLLLKDGLTHTSVNRIAKKAELSIGSIYFYFKNKEEIFASLQREGLEILHSNILAATEKLENPEEKLQQCARIYFQFTEDHSDYFDVINYFLSSSQIFFSDGIKKSIDDEGVKILRYMEGIVVEGIRKKMFQESRPGNFAVFFWASIHGLVQVRKLRQTVVESDNFTAFYQYSVNKLIDSIRHKEA
jgi:TetR/AcrR family transcriptional regulator